eukprot:TRINITY_DN6297_c0_g1_i3.p1 TRINITY_DN6297_c0_g1~~TRINITY_DN6297_c0_g1_i3.p1  ORF type:complete len:863 (+),score=103.72 TRINITY_DN6297_c0_g1_i3:290-2878(+)
MDSRIHISGEEIGVSGGGDFARRMEEARRSQIMDARPGPLLTANDIIKGRWKIIRKIGQGSFGEIYSGGDIHTNELVAIKVERVDSRRKVLKLEVAVLKKLQICPWVVQFKTCGRHNDVNYMVMELLGSNLSELRRKQTNQKFSMLTTCKLGVQMLRAIQSVHELGFLHRDIKPGNFAMGLGPEKRNTAFMIDFGLARKYVFASGEIRPPRDSAGFRGTARYASIGSHESKDLGRRDDLWSLFYLLIEFATGSLPWRRIKDKDKVGEMKKKLNHVQLVADLPDEFAKFMKHLQGLEFSDRPDYKYLHNLLTGLYHKLHGTENTPFDWDIDPVIAKRPRPIPSLQDLAFIVVSCYMEDYELPRVFPFSFKKRMLDFLIRVNNGRISRNMLDMLLDDRMTELDLVSCEFNEADYQHIATTCCKLKSLTLGATTDAIIRAIVTQNHNLEQLSIYCSSKFSQKGVKLIAENCPKLRSLKLKCSVKLTDKSIEPILKHCLQLEELSLYSCGKVKGTAFSKVVGSLRSSKIKLRSSTLGAPPSGTGASLHSLDLSYCELSKRGFKSLVKIASGLQSLHFTPLHTSFKITSSDFIGLVQSCTNLTSINLSTSHFEMDTILLEISKSCPKLSTLLLDGIGMTDFGLQNVTQRCNELQTLRFRYGDGVTDTSLVYIAKYCNLLKSLTLDFWNKFNQSSVSDQAIRHILLSCNLLQELSLCNCVVLTENCFPDETNAYFPALRFLNLSECVQLNDSAIKRITESCPNLKRLDLSNLNNLSEKSLDAIAMGCVQLEDLHLISCSWFTDEAIKKLLRGLPRCFVQMTRYNDFDLRGSSKEINIATFDDICARYPNTFRERAYEKARKRLFGLEP